MAFIAPFVRQTHTHYYTVTLKVADHAAFPTDPQWGAAFYLPNHDALQITSAVNLEVLYGPALAGYVNLNIVVRDEAAQLSGMALPGEIVHTEHWVKTMPCADETMVAQAQE